MNNYDKIRILWIDDLDGKPDTYEEPEKKLPLELQDYFEIIKHQDIHDQSSIGTPEHFNKYYGHFWKEQNESDICNFTPEIIAMDYNLNLWRETIHKFTTSPNNSDGISVELSSSLDDDSDSPKKIRILTESEKLKENSDANFEGLILGIFISSMLNSHPVAVIPMTRYGDSLRNKPEVKAIHLICKDILDIEFSQFGVAGNDRTWNKILKGGVRVLRERIKELYDKEQIDISPSDLKALINTENHEVLTLHSPFATRCLPVEGLFIDAPVSERRAKIKVWAKELFELKVNYQDWIDAMILADTVWAAYHDNKLIKEREALSLDNHSFTKEKVKSTFIKHMDLLSPVLFPIIKKEIDLQKPGWLERVNRGCHAGESKFTMINIEQDPQQTIKLLLQEWHSVFSDKFNAIDYTLLKDLKIARNKYIHNDDKSKDSKKGDKEDKVKADKDKEDKVKADIALALEKIKNLFNSVSAEREANAVDIDFNNLQRNIYFNATCKPKSVDILHTGKYSSKARRWGVLIITLKLLQMLLKIKNHSEQEGSNRFELDDTDRIKMTTGPIVYTSDLYLALFPAPFAQYDYFHEGKYERGANYWTKLLYRLKDLKNIGGDIGDLALNPEHILAGEDWVAHKSYGLHSDERQILRSLALDSNNKEELLSYEPIRRVLWGKTKDGDR